jgi:EAL domain-containing protein (putative c-di-GMP-specific phosphodiesterase class I)
MSTLLNPRSDAAGAADRFRAIAGNLPLCQASIRAAFETQQLRIAYQPILRAGDAALVGCEALLRWTHPLQGEQAPAQFVPILERSRLALEVGEWMIEEAARQVVSWNAAGADLRLAVNVAPVQVQAPDFPNRVAWLLDQSGLPPERLALEITQATLLDRPETTGHQLARLAMTGVDIHLDDFSFGPSSLSNLHALALTGIKLDRRFIGDLFEEGAKTELRTIVGLARQLGLRTVAESVQTDAELAAVEALGVDEVQGHLFCPAIPPEAFESYLDARRAGKP